MGGRVEREGECWEGGKEGGLGGRVGRGGRREGWEGGGRVVREGERVRRESWEGREEGGLGGRVGRGGRREG